MQKLNITHWREMISESARKLMKGELSAVNANALANLMGKTTASFKLRLEYSKAVGRTPIIDALMPPPDEEEGEEEEEGGDSIAKLGV